MVSSKVELWIPLPPANIRALVQGFGHYSVKAGAVKQYREIAKAIAITSSQKLIPGKVIIHHTWYLAKNRYEMATGSKCPKKYKNYRPQDEGNAIQALKPVIDGIVDSGLLKSDRAEFVKWGEYRRYATKKLHNGRCGIALVIEVKGVN